MRCRTVEKRLAEVVEADRKIALAPELEVHLRSCRSCASVATGLERTWAALGAFPAVEPSPNFAARVRERLTGRDPWHLRPEFGWQWMTFAAGLVMAVLITSTLRTLPTDLRADLSRADRLDDRFLRDLEQSLNRWEADYDAGPSSLVDTQLDELLASP